MSVVVATEDEVRYDARPIASEAGAATKRVVVGYGFWIFLLSDIVMFAANFAAYAVLTRPPVVRMACSCSTNAA
jgi:cytochrome o ubiquinol oxidase subunit III